VTESAERKGKAGRVVITFSRGWQTLVATRSLGRRGVEVVTGDEYAMTAASFSRHSIAEFRYPNPTNEPERFLDVLEQTVIEHKPEDEDVPYVLMPIHKETYLIARHRERFEPHIRVPLPDIEAIEKVHNKGTLASYAIERGLPIPKTWVPKSLAACMTYHNLRAFPAEKGAGVMRETVKAPQMEQIAADVLGPLGWHGVAELDFRWDGTPEGQPCLIEVNPRFWGGLIQAVESGWDYPWLLFRLAADGHIDPVEEGRFDVRTETPILAFLATIEDMADDDRAMDALTDVWNRAKDEFRGGSKRSGLRKLLEGAKEVLDVKARVSEAKRLLEQHKDNVYDILSSDDPLPALGALYPLAVFLRHGKVNMELLTGEGGPTGDDE